MTLFRRWKNLSIRLKFLTVFMVVLVLTAIGMYIMNLQLLRVVKDNDHMLNQSIPRLATHLQVKSTIMERINFVMLYVTTGDKEFRDRFYKTSDRAQALMQQLKANSSPDERKEIESFIIHSEDWEWILRDKVIPVYERQNKKDAIDTLNREAQPIAAHLMEEVEQMSQHRANEITRINQTMLGEAWKSVTFSYMIIAGTLLLAFLFALYMSRVMTRPVFSLLHGVRKMGQGDFSAQVQAETKDELGELSEAFNRMAVNIAGLVEELRQTNDRLREESIRAQESTRMKSEFLANMSHELRTPLTGIIGFAELLYEGAGGVLAPPQKEFTGNIVDAGEHLLSMIDDILDMTKIEAGKYELEMSCFDMKDLIDSTLIMMKPKAQQARIELMSHMPDTPCPVTADETRIRQVLLNFLNNAIKFSLPDRHVEVLLEYGEHEFTVRVVDEGIGIASDKLEKIFEQFYQNDGRLERKYEGAGLGLSLSRQLIELHKGILTVESEEHIGSTFSFVIPCVLSDSQKSVDEDFQKTEGRTLLLHPPEFSKDFSIFYRIVQESSIQFDHFMVKSEKDIVKAIHELFPDVVIVAAHYADELYMQMLTDVRAHWKGKLLAYIDQPIRLVERGQVMRTADQILLSLDEVLTLRHVPDNR
ncbi:sensor histidine kinase [Aneurinibacillus uraniidurans]|uniref:sensor histidine kinase n=1 Tax=Aneurinibacillus uraniidurans TaxID=2966586 RepID=UPI00234A80D7|nr:ATP-binding protein [Aneurinibacillus sp. B1]WCN36935.1 ATP-binding protein [Aneurinibacillus sp. B1]